MLIIYFVDNISGAFVSAYGQLGPGEYLRPCQVPYIHKGRNSMHVLLWLFTFHNKKNLVFIRNFTSTEAKLILARNTNNSFSFFGPPSYYPSAGR